MIVHHFTVTCGHGCRLCQNYGRVKQVRGNLYLYGVVVVVGLYPRSILAPARARTRPVKVDSLVQTGDGRVAFPLGVCPSVESECEGFTGRTYYTDRIKVSRSTVCVGAEGKIRAEHWSTPQWEPWLLCLTTAAGTRLVRTAAGRTPGLGFERSPGPDPRLWLMQVRPVYRGEEVGLSFFLVCVPCMFMWMWEIPLQYISLYKTHHFLFDFQGLISAVNLLKAL